MNAPKVTVLTAVRNGAAFLPETVESIRAQSFSDWEYIIVDDYSEDETVSVIEWASHRDSRIKLLTRKSCGGPYVAANDGLRAACGEYIVRIDADDSCPPKRIERQLGFLAEHKEYRACVTYWQAFNQHGLIPNTVTKVPHNSRVFRWALLLRGPSVHSAACFERAAMNELGGYRELPLSQDYRLWCEMSRRGWLGTVPEVLSYVRYHENRQTSCRPALQRDLATDILANHIEALTGQAWARTDLETLRAAGASASMPVAIGIEMLDRWDRLWQADPDLDDQDRRDLSQMSRVRRWKLLRANARRQPVRVFVGLLQLAASRRRLPSHGRTRVREVTQGLSKA